MRGEAEPCGGEDRERSRVELLTVVSRKEREGEED